ncbi:MAG: hypothetical protein L0Z50_24840, partial [Verrucomicrobiales bacterium]|nr:hypothetical protein [Verrucomicrobiales bacterium]
PWTQAMPWEEPTVYFSSVVSDTPRHLPALYTSLLRDLATFRAAHALTFHSAFGIASGPAGYRHMSRNGFLVLPRRRYLNKYELMSIDIKTAITPFWRELLAHQPDPIRRG